MIKPVFPGLTLTEELPGGAAGRIFRALAPDGRYYILKLFAPACLGLAGDEQGILHPQPHQHSQAELCYRLFLREAEISRELYAQYDEGTNSCWFFRGEIHELCPPEGGRLGAYILYDTFSGESLAEALESRQPHLDKNGALLCLEWTRRIAEALEQMHSHIGADGKKCPFLHLDIKPSNIYCTPIAPGGDEAMRFFRLLDLGSALPLGGDETSRSLRVEMGGSLSGTAGYAAPELMRAMESGDCSGLDEKADVYSLGAVLFRMLSGHSYDFDCLDIDSPCVRALPIAGKKQLKTLLEKLLESTGRMELHELYDELGSIIDTVKGRGLSRAVLFGGMANCLAALDETPDEALLAPVDTTKGTFPNFTAAMGRHRALCLVGSGMQGKTFSMLHCAAYLCSRYSDNLPVPLYVPLRRLGSSLSDTPISDYIATHYGGEVADDHAFALRQSLKKGLFLLLADGINELSGSPALPNVIAELDEFMALGVHTAVSSQTDPRKDILSGRDMELCLINPLKIGQINSYLKQNGLPPAGSAAAGTLAYPMLLKMYALSEKAVLHSSLTDNPALKFIPNARFAGEIILNYREYCLSKFLGTDQFNEARVVLRLMLPYLAYEMCLGDKMKLTVHLLHSETDHFFLKMQEKEFFPEMLSYGAPRFVPQNRWDDIDDYNCDKDRVCRCLMALGGSFDEDADYALLQRDMALSSRRMENVRAILSRCGLMDVDDSGCFFAHEELKYLFCGEYLSRFARGSKNTLVDILGRTALPAKALYHASCLADFAPGLDKLRGKADRLTWNMLREMDPECDLIATAGLLSPEGVKNLLTLELAGELVEHIFGSSLPETALSAQQLHRVAAITDLCLHDTEVPAFDEEDFSPDFSSLFWDEEDGKEDDEDFITVSPRAYCLTDEDNALVSRFSARLEELGESDLGLGALASLPPSLSGLIAALPYGGGMDKPIPPRGYMEILGILRGRVSTAAANLLEILANNGPLSGFDLSNLDLSAAMLREKDLRGCRLSGCRIYAHQLLGWQTDNDGEAIHMAYGLSGRYLYLLWERNFRGFDMHEGCCMFSLPLKEGHSPYAWFWLDDKNHSIVLCDEAGGVLWLDCFTGRTRFSYDTEFAPNGLKIKHIMGNDDMLFLEDNSASVPRTLRIDFDESGEAHCSPWREGSRIADPDRQNQLRFDPDIRLGSSGGRRLCLRKKEGRLVHLGFPGREYSLMAVSHPVGKISLLSCLGIEEFSLTTGELSCRISARDPVSLENTDLRLVSPEFSTAHRDTAAKLGALI